MASDSVNKSQICYLAQAGQVDAALELYDQYQKRIGKHDFELLTEFGLILLEQGARSSQAENQLLSIYGSSIATLAASLDVLEAGIKSTHAETQMASIQFLGKFQDDRSDELLLKAMSSEFFQARLEAAYQLASRKHPAATGQIESLMYKVPPPLRFLFPQFFALVGTSDAMGLLKQLMEDPYISVRIEAILSVARFGRDDLLPHVRALLTHLNIAEQEASAYALGIFKDSKSLRKLKKLMDAKEDAVQLAAACALIRLGESSAKQLLLTKARALNPFAISALSEVPEGADLLAELCKHPDVQIRFNAAIALIKLRDSRAVRVLREILICDTRDLTLQPIFSLGRSQMAWKVVASTAHQQKNNFYDPYATSLALREALLRETIELPEKEFLKVADAIFASRQSDLVPLLVELLANLHSEESQRFLKQKAQQAGAPLIRGYASLALFRMQMEGSYGEYLKTWVLRQKGEEMIHFKPLVTLDQRFGGGGYELTPEDSSRLFIDCIQAFADRHETASVDLMLEMIRSGNPKNRAVLAGLLLRTLQ